VASHSGPNPVYIEDVVTEGNLATISRTIPIDISTTPGVVEHVFIRADCSLEEIEYKEREKLARSCLAYCVWDIHVYNALFMLLVGERGFCELFMLTTDGFVH